MRNCISASKSSSLWHPTRSSVWRSLTCLCGLLCIGQPLHADDPLVIPDSAVVIAETEPARLLTDPDLYLLPAEPIQAWCRLRFGFAPDQLKFVRYVGWKQNRKALAAGWLLHFSQSAPMEAIVKHLCPDNTIDQHAGYDVWSAKTGTNAAESLSLCRVTENTVLVAPRAQLISWLDDVATHEPSQDAPRYAVPTGTDFRAHVRTNDPMLMLHLARQLLERHPESAATFQKLMGEVRQVELQASLDNSLKLELDLWSDDAAEAAAAEDSVEALLSLTEQRLQGLTQIRRIGEDPISTATADYLDRLTQRMLRATRPKRDRNGLKITWEIESPMLLPVAFALISQPVTSHPPAPGRLSINRLKALGIAMHTALAQHNEFPTAYNVSADGKPLLSWRVHLLQYMEEPERELYREFHLSEPWDSPHNKSLIERMPEIYRSSQPSAGHTTRFLVPFGRGAMFHDTTGTRPAEVTDGFSNTVLIVEVNRENAVIWTKPEDLDVTQPDLLDGIVEPGQLTFRALMGDGALRNFGTVMEEDALRALWTISGGEPIPD